MQQQWRIQIRGRQRQQVDSNLLAQAVIALGRQLWDEAQPTTADGVVPAARPSEHAEAGQAVIDSDAEQAS